MGKKNNASSKHRRPTAPAAPQPAFKLPQTDPYFKTLIENSADGIIILDPEGVLRFCNSTAETIFGKSKKALIGSHFGIPLQVGKFSEIQVLSPKQKKFKAAEMRVLAELEWDRPVYVVSIRDITERKKAHRDLAKTRDMALRLAEERSQFLANMSHEIRTPLNAIIGMTGLLTRTPLSPKQQEFSQTIRQAGETLLDLINDILDFSKIQANKLILELVDFNPRLLVEEAVSLIAVKAQKKNLEVLSRVAPAVPSKLHGDPTRLRQVLMNFLSNAVKFTEQGEILIEVDIQEEGKENITLDWSVKDTGIGLSQEDIDRVFQPFTQADASTSRKFGGTGLGLAISKAIVKKMGGAIKVESSMGKGSLFGFTTVLRKSSSEPHTTTENEKTLWDKKILVVDDNTTSRKILMERLKAWGAAAHSVGSGTDALQELSQAAGQGHPFDAALTDMHMPSMDGMSLSQKILQDKNLPKTPLIMMTPLGQAAESAEMKEAGVRFSISKPVREEILFDALCQLLNPPSPFQEPPQQKKAQKRRPHFRILIVDDNRVNQQLARLQLDELGYTADTVGNGLEALEALEKIPYDLVLMDCEMPEMDGFTATRKIREKHAGKKRPLIVAMTANAFSGDREKCLKAGMDHYIAKPVRIEDLAEILEKLDVSVDKKTLKSLRDKFGEENAKLLLSLISTFLEDTPKYICEMYSSAARQDASGLRAAAHALKGGSSQFAAQGLSRIAALVESLARENRIVEAEKLLPQLEEEAIQTQWYLQEEFRKWKKSTSIPLKILIVAGEKRERKIIAQATRHISQKTLIQEAASESEAFQKIDLLKPDLVFLELHPPRQKGQKICEYIRKSPPLTHAKILGMLTSLKVESRNDLLSQGVDDFVYKPLDVESLKEQAKKIIDSKAA